MSSLPSCRRCLYALTGPRERCDDCLKTQDGLILPYKHFVEGDPGARLLELQRKGERNIVIGGEGEHEVNALWGIGQAYKHLANICEVCGGLVVKEGLTQLLLMKPYGPSFVLVWMHGKLYRISERRHIPWWEAKPAEST